MTRPIRPRLLARHARRLADHHNAAGRPQVTWLRRSISASYYAVFHAISLAVAQQIAPHATPDDQLRLTRSMQHGSIADVCAWLTGQGRGKTHVQDLVLRLRGNPDVTDVATIFLRLQQARHEADYDHLATFRKATTLGYHAQAQRALDVLDRLPGHGRRGVCCSRWSRCTPSSAEAAGPGQAVGA